MNGKILVASHDIYFSWLQEKADETKKKFMNRIKLWLTGSEHVDDSKIINLNDAVSQGNHFENYKIIKFHHNDEIDDETNNALIAYVENGGSLFCASTPWGFLQLHPHKKLTDMCLYQFLKFYTGILFTPAILTLPTECEVSQNQSKYSHFDVALEKACSDPKKMGKYLNTVQSGFDTLCAEEILTAEKINEISEKIITNCKNCGWQIIPSEKHPVTDPGQSGALKLIGKTYNYTEGVKAPGIEEFPGDFKQDPALLENIELKISCQFQERVSTGYYLPAGTTLTVNVSSGSFEGWSVRIGAHSDDLSNCNPMPRWPVVTTVKKFDSEQMNVSSAFGGLIYLESPKAGTITVNLSNVVESPFVDLTKPETVGNWPRRRNAIGLWLGFYFFRVDSLGQKNIYAAIKNNFKSPY